MTIRVVQPVVAESNGRAIGILEVNLPYEPIAAKVRADTRQTMTRLAVGLTGLYALLALISWWTTRALRRHAAANEYQALHDPLTGLPNRELFRRVAEERLTDRRDGHHAALVLIDLDRFKEVNDTLGHHAGDELLRIVGRRLTESLRTDDTVARLGGDEFGIVLPRTVSRSDTVELLSRVREEVGRAVTLDGAVLSVAASFGVCFYPDADTVEGLLQHADAAMYRGKHGPTGVVVYDPTEARPSSDTLVMQHELRQAMEDDQLMLHYQPKIELSTGRVIAVEALVRWQHPARGLLAPAQFLPVAERSELIQPLTRWVLARALADYTAWTEAGHDWTVAVNVSARNLSALTFVDTVRDLLREGGVSPDRLCLEVTETALAFDDGVARQVISALAGAGISMSVDDFGIGFTGLSQLQSLDVSEIKIDRTFVASVTTHAQDQAIVRSIIELAHRLGCVATAEGVETPDTADWLLEAGCDNAQGYLWLPPAPWETVHAGTEASSHPPTGLCERKSLGMTQSTHSRLVGSLCLVLALAATTGCGATSPRGTSTSSGHAEGVDRALRALLPTSVRERGTLRLGTDASYAPMSSFGADGRSIVGVEPDLGAAVGHVLGVRARFVDTDFTRLIPDVANGSLDLGMSAVTDTPQRAKSVDFVDYFSAGTAIVVQRGNPAGVTNIQGLCGRVAAVEAGTTQVDLLRRAQANCPSGRIAVKRCATNSDALLQLRTGRAAAVLTDLPPAVHLINDPRTKSQYQLASTTQYEPGLYGVVVAKDQRALRDAIQGAFEKLLRDGRYADVLQRWGVDDGSVARISINSDR